MKSLEKLAAVMHKHEEKVIPVLALFCVALLAVYATAVYLGAESISPTHGNNGVWLMLISIGLPLLLLLLVQIIYDKYPKRE